MSQQYQVIFNNNTTSAGTLCCFQQGTSGYFTEGQPLAWQVQIVAAGSEDTISWTPDYCFVLGQPGQLNQGDIFAAYQTLNADLNDSNSVNLVYDNNECQLTGQSAKAPGGVLYVQVNSDVPQAGAAFGIGMNSMGTFALPAMPGCGYEFPADITYWLAFGNYIQGQALYVPDMLNIQQVVFPAGVYTMYATLNADNTWTVSQNPGS